MLRPSVAIGSILQWFQNTCSRVRIWDRIFGVVLLDSLPVGGTRTRQKVSLWQWIASFAKLSSLVEEARLWGTGCSCHEAERKAKTKVDCSLASRRLREAGPFLEQWLGKLRKLLSQDPATFEGNEETFSDFNLACRHLLAKVPYSFAWVGHIPWLLARADEPAIAKACLDQYDSAEPSAHHRASVCFMSKHRRDLERVAAGGDPSDALKVELDMLRKVPLSEARAEGWHRSIKLTLTRAPAAKVPYLLASNRLSQNLRLCNRFIESAEGEQRFRTEWLRYKRVLQVAPPGSRASWRPVKLKMKKFKDKAYRLKEYARMDWPDELRAACEDDEADCADAGVLVGFAAVAAAWQKEYVEAVLEVGGTYMVPTADAPGTVDSKPLGVPHLSD